MSTARGFRYALEPVRQQREWKLQAAQARLAALQAELAACESRIAQLNEQCAREAAAAARAWQRGRDPASKAAALAWLARLQRDAQLAGDEAGRLRAEVAQAREQCAARQRELEALVQHREDALREHRGEMERRSAAQADAEWCARLPRAGEAA
jgi:flagellar biosynthesis chaperone FliJ